MNYWKKGNIQFVLSLGIIQEYERVSKKLAEKYSDVDINQILSLILSYSEIIHCPNIQIQGSHDHDDDKFLACALTGNVKIVVSGDKHLLKVSGYKDILVLTPREFIEKYFNRDEV